MYIPPQPCLALAHVSTLLSAMCGLIYILSLIICESGFDFLGSY
jgi:hypothetical protein